MLFDISGSQSPTPTLTRMTQTKPLEIFAPRTPGIRETPLRVKVVSQGKLGDVSTFRTKAKEPVQFKFSEVGAWVDFDVTVQKNLSRIRSLNESSWELSADSQFVARIGAALSALLEKNNIQAKFLSSPPAGQIGQSHISVTLNSSCRPVLVGFHEPNTELVRLCDDELLLKVLNLSPQELCPSDKGYRRAVDTVTQTMLVNDLRVGYLSASRITRFFCITETETGNGLRLLVSAPVMGAAFVPTLLALTLEVYFASPYLKFPRGLEVNAVTRPDPPLHGLSPQAVTEGKVRWWVINKLNRLQYYIHFNPSIAGCYYFKPVYGWYMGTLYEASEPEVQQAVMCKVATTKQHIECLDNEASMFEHLESKRLNILPQRILYGFIFDKFHVLTFRPFGRPITREDLSLRTMEQMRYALQTLHVYHIRHRDIRLESFYIDHDDMVRIANLGRAQRFKSLPDVARKAEMAELEELFK